MKDFKINKIDLLSVNRDYETHTEVMNNELKEFSQYSIPSKEVKRKAPTLMLSGSRLKTVNWKTSYSNINYKGILKKYLLMNITSLEDDVFSKDKEVKGNQLLKM